MRVAPADWAAHCAKCAVCAKQCNRGDFSTDRAAPKSHDFSIARQSLAVSSKGARSLLRASGTPRARTDTLLTRQPVVFTRRAAARHAIRLRAGVRGHGQVLTLSKNILREVPLSIGACKKLKTLELKDNPGLSIPPKYIVRQGPSKCAEYLVCFGAAMDGEHKLDLSQRKLTSFPPEVTWLGRALRSLDLSSNISIGTLPYIVCELSGLTALTVDSSKVWGRITQGLGFLTALTHLSPRVQRDCLGADWAGVRHRTREISAGKRIGPFAFRRERFRSIPSVQFLVPQLLAYV